MTWYKIEPDEHATILAALRTYQAAGYGDPFNRPERIHDIATNGDTVISLDDDAVGKLCDALNHHGEPQPAHMAALINLTVMCRDYVLDSRRQLDKAQLASAVREAERIITGQSDAPVGMAEAELPDVSRMTAKVCSMCKGSDVICDASAAWDVGAQRFDLTTVHDNAFCNHCDGETHIEDASVARCAGCGDVHSVYDLDSDADEESDGSDAKLFCQDCHPGDWHPFVDRGKVRFERHAPRDADQSQPLEFEHLGMCFWEPVDYREPKKGEYYLSGAVAQAWRAPNDLRTKYHIVRALNKAKRTSGWAVGERV